MTEATQVKLSRGQLVKVPYDNKHYDEKRRKVVQLPAIVTRAYNDKASGKYAVSVAYTYRPEEGQANRHQTGTYFLEDLKEIGEVVDIEEYAKDDTNSGVYWARRYLIHKMLKKGPILFKVVDSFGRRQDSVQYLGIAVGSVKWYENDKTTIKSQYMDGMETFESSVWIRYIVWDSIQTTHDMMDEEKLTSDFAILRQSYVEDDQVLMGRSTTVSQMDRQITNGIRQVQGNFPWLAKKMLSMEGLFGAKLSKEERAKIQKHVKTIGLQELIEEQQAVLDKTKRIFEELKETIAKGQY